MRFSTLNELVFGNITTNAFELLKQGKYIQTDNIFCMYLLKRKIERNCKVSFLNTD